MGTDKNPFNQLCNQVIAIKSLSLGHYHCVTGSSILHSFGCLSGGFVGEQTRVWLCSKPLKQVLWLSGK